MIIIDFTAYKMIKRIMSPEQYAEVVQFAMKNKDKWVHRQICDTNIIVASALKNKESWKKHNENN